MKHPDPDKNPKKPVCPSCFKGGYRIEAATDGRPQFHCDHCGKIWTSGHSGFPYVK